MSRDAVKINGRLYIAADYLIIQTDDILAEFDKRVDGTIDRAYAHGVRTMGKAMKSKIRSMWW